VFSRKPVFGYSLVASASIAIAILGFLVWGHHMFVAGQSVYASLVFSAMLPRSPQMRGDARRGIVCRSFETNSP
ncbi:MAG: cbb3-type cytochrome c oxidase subunit I, partial [Armatimonadetes bacterium]|nr:cbb3-type cytochrome c oxidase subunit I [Armatimonadota bacterium]